MAGTTETDGIYNETRKREGTIQSENIKTDMKRKGEINLLVQNVSDYDSVYSLVSIDHTDVIRYAGNRWKRFSRNRKECWSFRAARLNREPVVGKFEHMPNLLTNRILCESLTMEWRHMCKGFRSAMMREAGRNLSQRSYSMSFPGVRSQVGRQYFRRSYMSPIIHKILFGEGYSNLKDNELIKKVKKSAIVHIASRDRMKQLFCMNDLCGVNFIIDEFNYNCSGKVKVVRDGRNLIGFIMKERRDKWTVKMMNGDVKVLPRVNCNDSGYIYANDNRRTNAWTISYYWPICMKFSFHCQHNWQFMLCRVVLRRNTIVSQLSS